MDAVSCGTLMSKSKDEAYNLMEEMTLTTTSGLMNVANPRRLEVSSMLMPLLYLPQRWMP